MDPRLILEQELGLMSFGAVAAAAAELDAWRSRGYQVLSLTDAGYPANLRVIDGRPPLLFVAGALDPEDLGAVAVIGTRSPTAAGSTLAREVATAIARSGRTVVSGLAAGIDTEAHVAALGARRRTVAVLGHGLDHIYPPENAGLAAQVAGSGALISQFWPEQAPTRQKFPARNAVMSGLSAATVIVEAGERSGTRIQARHAVAQGRRLILMRSVVAQEWGRKLVDESCAVIADTPSDVIDLLRR